MKTKIICLVGESGSGKTFIADYLEKEFDIPMILSRTTRPRRTPDEGGHLFVTDNEFDMYSKESMIAFTVFGAYRYCCLFSDVTDPVMSYVIDEYGLKYLRDNFSDWFDIFSVRVYMADHIRETLVSEERMLRDEGKFTMGEENFDYFLDTSSFEENPRRIAKLVIRMYQKFNEA